MSWRMISFGCLGLVALFFIFLLLFVPATIRKDLLGDQPPSSTTTGGGGLTTPAPTGTGGSPASTSPISTTGGTNANGQNCNKCGLNTCGCVNCKDLSEAIPASRIKNNKLANAYLVNGLAVLWQRNKTLYVTEAYPASSNHASSAHCNGRAIDIALWWDYPESRENIDKLESDIKAVFGNGVYILNEYIVNTTYTTGGHLHLQVNK